MILDWDRSLFYAINHLPHPAILDWAFSWFWSPKPWIPVACGILGWMIWRHRQKGLLVLAALALSLTCVDRSIHEIWKPYFHRIRPAYDLPAVITPMGKPGGELSFPSAHSANTAAAATCFALWSPLGGSVSGAIALLVGFSRIYHGAHYPLDVLVGGLYGWVTAFLVIRLLLRVRPVWRSLARDPRTEPMQTPQS